MKTVSSTLSSLPVEGQGLLIAAADPNTSTACLVGTVPVASDGSFADAAGKGSGQGVDLDMDIPWEEGQEGG
jgi:hypothetical protein